MHALSLTRRVARPPRKPRRIAPCRRDEACRTVTTAVARSRSEPHFAAAHWRRSRPNRSEFGFFRAWTQRNRGPEADDAPSESSFREMGGQNSAIGI